MIIRSGPIAIGQAYRGRLVGHPGLHRLVKPRSRIVSVNSNPATALSDSVIAGVNYVEPLNLAATIEIVEERERPDALLPSLGRQSALTPPLGGGPCGAAG